MPEKRGATASAAGKLPTERSHGAGLWAVACLIPALLLVPLPAGAASLSLDAPASVRIDGAETDNLHGYKLSLNGILGIVGLSHEEYSFDVLFQSCVDEMRRYYSSGGGDPAPLCDTSVDVSMTSILLELPGETIRTVIGYGIGTAKLAETSAMVESPSFLAHHEWGKADITQTLLQINYRPGGGRFGADFGFHQFQFQGRRTFSGQSAGLPSGPEERSFSERGSLIYLGFTLFFSS